MCYPFLWRLEEEREAWVAPRSTRVAQNLLCDCISGATHFCMVPTPGTGGHPQHSAGGRGRRVRHLYLGSRCSECSGQVWSPERRDAAQHLGVAEEVSVSPDAPVCSSAPLGPVQLLFKCIH